MISAGQILFYSTHIDAADGARKKSIVHDRTRYLAFLRLSEVSDSEFPWKNLLKELQYLSFFNMILYLDLALHMLYKVFYQRQLIGYSVVIIIYFSFKNVRTI